MIFYEKLRASHEGLLNFSNCCTFKKMKTVGKAASANGKAAGPEWTAEDSGIEKMAAVWDICTTGVGFLWGKQTTLLTFQIQKGKTLSCKEIKGTQLLF